MKYSLAMLFGIVVSIFPNSGLCSQAKSNTQIDQTLGTAIEFSRAGYLNSWDNKTYEIIISWQTNSHDIVAINIYRKEGKDDVFELFDTVSYEIGRRNYFVRPGKRYQYELRTIDNSLKESENYEALTITTGWNRVSRDLSEIDFINKTAKSKNNMHEEFALRALGLGITSEECKKMLITGTDSEDLVIRAFSLLGLGYVRGWNNYISIFEENIGSSDPVVRWAAISSLYYPKGGIDRRRVRGKKEFLCKNLYELSNDNSKDVRAKIFFLHEYMECSENHNNNEKHIP